jgi:predicted phosphodiesterase
MVKFILISDSHYGLDGKTHAKHLKFWKRVEKAIKDENVQALLWAGDIASFRQRHFYKSLEMARQYVSVPILLVKGNHDFYCGKDPKDRGVEFSSLEEVNDRHKKWMTKFDIHHLEDAPYIVDDVIVCGFDGWYAVPNPGTNCKYWIPKNVQGQPFVSQYLVTKAWRDLQNCLDVDTGSFRKSVLVTHHNPYGFSQLGKVKTVDELMEEGVEYTGHGANIKFLPEIREKFDVMCCGHTHGYKNDCDEGIQIYNCGSDYNKPKFLVFEV